MALLTMAERRALPKEQFAIPENAPGSGSYPIPDEEHAQDALSRVQQEGTTRDQARVKSAVRKAFPSMDVKGGLGLKKAPAMPKADRQAAVAEAHPEMKTFADTLAGRKSPSVP